LEQHKNPSIAYRPEIDGLRAVAVLPVILFHGGFAVFAGGFVGVDIFFVISGFLITSIILSDLEKGRFSVRRFYERRARRILPALFFVCLVCVPFAYAWMLPSGLERFGESLVAVATFSANIFFWSTQEYFGPAAELQPMLHTWSLAVEEQYYVFIPLFLMWCWSLGRRWLFILVLLASAVSLLLSEWSWRHEPTANFYLLPTRAWELLVGSLIAFVPGPGQLSGPGSRLFKLIAPYVGLALILYSIFWFDEDVPIPGVYALAPVGGTALIITGTTPGHPIARLLRLRPLVAVGLISYSAYLWHQPLFAFARIRLLGEPGHWVAAGLTLLSLALAYVSWRFVEAPFRTTTGKINRAPLVPAAAGLAALSAIGIVFIMSGGLPTRLPPADRAFIEHYDNYQDVENNRFGKCFFGEDHEYETTLSFEDDCHGDADTQRFVLIGDSYSAHYLHGLNALLRPGESIAQFNISGCLPILELPTLTPQRCSSLNPERFASIQTQDIVIVSAQWPTAMTQPESFEYGALEHTLATLSADLPSEQIVLIGASPEWPGALPVQLVRSDLHQTLEPGDMLVNATLEQKTAINRSLSELAAAYDVAFIDPVAQLCDEDECVVALTYENGVEISTSDHGHLTPPAAERVLAEFIQGMRAQRWASVGAATAR